MSKGSVNFDPSVSKSIQVADSSEDVRGRPYKSVKDIRPERNSQEITFRRDPPKSLLSVSDNLNNEVFDDECADIHLNTLFVGKVFFIIRDADLPFSPWEKSS